MSNEQLISGWLYSINVTLQEGESVEIIVGVETKVNYEGEKEQ